MTVSSPSFRPTPVPVRRILSILRYGRAATGSGHADTSAHRRRIMFCFQQFGRQAGKQGHPRLEIPGAINAVESDIFAICDCKVISFEERKKLQSQEKVFEGKISNWYTYWY